MLEIIDFEQILLADLETFFQWHIAWEALKLFFLMNFGLAIVGLPWQWAEEKKASVLRLLFGAMVFPFVLGWISALFYLVCAIF